MARRSSLILTTKKEFVHALLIALALALEVFSMLAQAHRTAWFLGIPTTTRLTRSSTALWEPALTHWPGRARTGQVGTLLLHVYII